MSKARRPRKALRRYQRIFKNKIVRLNNLILALPMGSGKTGTCLTAMLDLLDDGEVKKVLIVAPLLVAVGTWPDEIDDWEHTADLTWTLLRADDDDPDIKAKREMFYRDARDLWGFPPKDAAKFANRMRNRAKEWKLRKLAETGTEVHIINREALPWLWKHFGEGERWPYDMLVVDEASMFKNAKIRTPLKELTRFGVAAKARKFAKRVVLLTGTPAPKGLENLFGLSYIADGGDRLGNSKHLFMRTYFDKKTVKMGTLKIPKYIEKPWAEAKIMDRLGDIMFSMREEDCVDLPPMIPIPMKVSLPPRILDQYKRFERTLYSEEYDVEAVNKGVLQNKLLQFANGSMYNEDREEVWIHDEKLEALEQIVEDANGMPVLCAYTFAFDIRRIRKLFPKAVVFGRGNVVEQKRAWNRGEIDFMAAHPASIGHGQNIQYGGHISVWYGLTPDLELYQQFNKRLHRSGQTHTVFNHHLIATGTYDEKMLPLLTRRDATQDRIIEAVRVNLAA
ncbi:MAG TPA: DEAD/DEAH box helicase [Aurantimonas coralicida]|uniref:DEAD/DEAH box helicase n=2 Tax=root TaxID=1 RepID=A0A9C9NKA4_9HYPH|nr:DEAD/DEAH box helicase [Aurantimonas coralicida]HEU02589.1 DEAD/DEAH box helicase [Aurantimonas coralicida]